MNESDTGRPRWAFDPQDAVSLLLGKREEGFPFEFPITLYLLFAWALWPTLPGESDTTERKRKLILRKRVNLQNTARCLGMVVTLTKLGKSRLPKASRFKLITELIHRVRRKWYIEFHDQYIENLGGIRSQFVNSRSAKSRKNKITTEWKDTLLERHLVSYFCKMQRLNPKHTTMSYTVVHIQNDVFGVSDYRKRKPSDDGKPKPSDDGKPKASDDGKPKASDDGKPKASDDGKRKNDGKPEVISDKKIQAAWEIGHATAVLLYSLGQKLPELVELDIGSRFFFKSLCEIASDKNKVAEMLLYYKGLTEILNPVMNHITSMHRWKVLDIAAEVPSVITDDITVREVFDEKARAIIGF